MLACPHLHCPAVIALVRPLLPLFTLLASTAALAQAGHAHVHGAVALDIVVEAKALTVRLEAPQDSLLGHERVPRTAAERQAAAALLTRLADGARLFALPADRACKLASTEVDAPLLQVGAAAAGGGAQAAEHAEVEASWRFDCTRTDGWRSLDLGALLDAFPRIQRISAQVAGPAGQHKAELRRPARVLVWGR
jgi:Protein of unknown function (DUF2796)